MENQLNEKVTSKTPSSDSSDVKFEEKKLRVKHSLLRKEFMTPVGNKIQKTYELEYDEKHRCELVVEVGEEDIDEFIQASASSTDMAFLQREARRTGQYPTDPNAEYGVDSTLMPTNIHELYKTTQDIEKCFNRLGDTGKAAFGSLEAYKSAVIGGTAEDILRAHYYKLAESEIAKQKKSKEKEDK